jgi:ubiquinone/menaquinone biosynthesis C-methylase UbiE
MTADEARKEQEAEFHDRLRSLYDTDPERYRYYTSNNKFYSVAVASDRFYYKWMRRYATGKRVLDFGSGNGIHSVEVARFADHVTGIDISAESVEISQEKARQAGLADKTTFLVMDAENLEFEPATFDVVSVRGVLHHMDLDAALGQIRKVLKPDGRAIFLEAMANNPIIHAYRMRTPQLRTAWEAQHILRYEDAAKMRRYFGRVELRGFHLTAIVAVPFRNTPVFRPLLTVLDGIDRAVLSVPGLKQLCWIGCFQLSEPRSA